ncbi:hypothetical protein N5U04_09875 [Aliarcobacter butzleri]|uniref:hypothetical protein n=1 Tax=Arcobacteraceae TaxID=2808963 RepID=UPI0021B36BED|nr:MULTISPECIES: hypothetical protein [Arcobacteraceae]MCT7549814.1 hypothetical protein [Aliarcobacter butzleri]MCT7559876.1 hypothetical protein [Aliarcobacter butzleri]MCT7911652.1 hypothetical protein [Arcobacter lacus]
MENITYARGRIVELNETLDTLTITKEPIKKALENEVSKDNMDINKVRKLLTEYENKTIEMSNTHMEIFTIKEKWGIK